MTLQERAAISYKRNAQAKLIASVESKLDTIVASDYVGMALFGTFAKPVTAKVSLNAFQLMVDGEWVTMKTFDEAVSTIVQKLQ